PQRSEAVMARWAAAVGSGLLAAAAAGFLFWVVNSTHQVNGVGLLRRQDWPVSSPGAWVAVGAALGMVGALVRAARRAGHARTTREVAEELGRAYAESSSLPPEARSLPVFDGWSDGRHAMTGRAGAGPVTVFDYTTVTRGGESDSVTEGTVALLPVDGLAAFDLPPRAPDRRPLGWARLQGLAFTPS